MTSLRERVKRLGLLDIKLAQGAAIFVGLVVVKLLEPILNIYEINIWWFVLIAALCGIKPVCTALIRR